jgi:hypothetical protein
MGLLRIGVASLASIAAGCYSPELRDCTLTCNAASDCADGQVCGSDHFCAAPGIAGQCAFLPGDAGGSNRDGGIDAPKMPDARPDAAMPDAPTHAVLTISIEGKGRVTVQTIGTCDESGPQNGHCTYAVPLNLAITVQAQPYEDQRFDKWTTPVCASMSMPSCTFTPVGPTTVGVKFRKES